LINFRSNSISTPLPNSIFILITSNACSEGSATEQRQKQTACAKKFGELASSIEYTISGEKEKEKAGRGKRGGGMRAGEGGEGDENIGGGGGGGGGERAWQPSEVVRSGVDGKREDFGSFKCLYLTICLYTSLDTFACLCLCACV
jgi:hypothetical protein